MKKRKTTIDEIGVFNILLIGGSPIAISVADNINSTFKEDGGGDVQNHCHFNIIGDIDANVEMEIWFNDFIFELSTTATKYNNIVVSEKFKDWMLSPMAHTKRLYMKKLLQALNFVIVDVSPDDGECIFDQDIPQYKFNPEQDFGLDLFKWIDCQLGKVNKMSGMVRLVRSLSGRGLPFLGDAFGCLSGKKYSTIVHADKMRYEVPILYDEFCNIMKDNADSSMEDVVVVRSNSALASFFK